MTRRVEIELVKDRLNKCADCIFCSDDTGCFAPETLYCDVDSPNEHWEIVKEDEE